MEDVDCMVYNAKKDYFPSLNFLTLTPSQPTVRYSATFVGKLGSIPIEGTTFSGLTRNEMNVDPLVYPFVSPVFTASIISINNGANGKHLGDVYIQDLIKEPLDNSITRERLAVVEGSKIFFKETTGHMEILGNTLAGPTEFVGTLCIAK